MSEPRAFKRYKTCSEPWTCLKRWAEQPAPAGVAAPPPYARQPGTLHSTAPPHVIVRPVALRPDTSAVLMAPRPTPAAQTATYAACALAYTELCAAPLPRLVPIRRLPALAREDTFTCFGQQRPTTKKRPTAKRKQRDNERNKARRTSVAASVDWLASAGPPGAGVSAAAGRWEKMLGALRTIAQQDAPDFPLPVPLERGVQRIDNKARMAEEKALTAAMAQVLQQAKRPEGLAPLLGHPDPQGGPYPKAAVWRAAVTRFQELFPATSGSPAETHDPASS